MSDKLKNIIKEKVNELISENDSSVIRKSKSVTGDVTASRLAKSSVAIDKIKDNLRSMGVNPSDVDSFHTVEQLSVMSFDFHYKILGNKTNEWDQNVVKHNKKHRAKVNKELSSKYKSLALILDDGRSIVFDPTEIVTNIPSTDKKVKGLKDGKKYKVKIGRTLHIPNQDHKYYNIEIVNINTGESYDDGSGENQKNTSNGNKSKGGSIRISSGKNSPWVTGNIEKNINNKLKDGVSVRKSEKHTDTLVIEWYNPLNDGTEAILVSTNNIWNLFNGNKLKSTSVRIGRKVGGVEEMKNSTDGTITLPNN